MPAELGEEREGTDRQLPRARREQALSLRTHSRRLTRKQRGKKRSYKYKVVEGKLFTEKATASLCCSWERFMLFPFSALLSKGVLQGWQRVRSRRDLGQEGCSPSARQKPCWSISCSVTHYKPVQLWAAWTAVVAKFAQELGHVTWNAYKNTAKNSHTEGKGYFLVPCPHLYP